MCILDLQVLKKIYCNCSAAYILRIRHFLLLYANEEKCNHLLLW